MVISSNQKNTLLKKGGCYLFLTLFLSLISPLGAQIVDNKNSNQPGNHTNSAAKDVAPTAVELQVFEGHALNCFARLMWTSEVELNFNYYDLEWSEDGVSFEKIESFDGMGGSNPFSYNYTDTEASNHNYYRLKMINMNGSYNYSAVVYIETGCDNDFQIEMFPNPVQSGNGSIQLKFYTQHQEATIFIHNSNGKLEKQLSIGVSEAKSWNTIQLDITDLESGIYFVKIPGSKGAKSFMVK